MQTKKKVINYIMSNKQKITKKATVILRQFTYPLFRYTKINEFHSFILFPLDVVQRRLLRIRLHLPPWLLGTVDIR